MKSKNVQVMLYDKCLEIKQNSGKDYFYDIWKKKGHQEGQPVTRLEFRFLSGSLKSFFQDKGRSIEMVYEHIYFLLHRYIQNNFTHRIPSNERISRCPLTPFWKEFIIFVSKQNGKELEVHPVSKNLDNMRDYALQQIEHCLHRLYAIELYEEKVNDDLTREEFTGHYSELFQGEFNSELLGRKKAEIQRAF